jgi:type II secretory pathway pseudopilin PulG
MKLVHQVCGHFHRNRIAAFSLVEILASVVVLASGAVGITAAWRLADQKALVARLDDRATRILREYYELQTFAPDYLFSDAESAGRDPDANGIPLKAGTTRSGYLYHPKKISLDGGLSPTVYEDKVPYTISLSADGTVLTLTYQALLARDKIEAKTINLNSRRLTH